MTPFDREGTLQEDDLRELVRGSKTEAELMRAEERARVVEIVVEEADVPVLAGTGHPGFHETLRQTSLEAEAGQTPHSPSHRFTTVTTTRP